MKGQGLEENKMNQKSLRNRLCATKEMASRTWRTIIEMITCPRWPDCRERNQAG